MLAVEPTVPATGLFCVQAVVVPLSSPVLATVNVTAFDPADQDELRGVATTVARSLRLVTVPARKDSSKPDPAGGCPPIRFCGQSRPESST
jgi:hypothetical protein